MIYLDYHTEIELFPIDTEIEIDLDVALNSTGYGIRSFKIVGYDATQISNNVTWFHFYNMEISDYSKDMRKVKHISKFQLTYSELKGMIK